MFSPVINLPTEFGEFKSFCFKENEKEHFVLFTENINKDECYVRIHSECLTGDVFGSQKCDCGMQLQESLKKIALKGGVLIYLRQEGRGIGLFNKIKAYSLQEEGYDTVEANLKLNLPEDNRDYAAAIDIINYFSLAKIKLLTNNPNKLSYLKKNLNIAVERAELEVFSNAHNIKYLKTKLDKMNHLLGEIA